MAVSIAAADKLICASKVTFGSAASKVTMDSYDNTWPRISHSWLGYLVV